MAISFDPTEEQELIQRTTREFAQRVLAPRAAERDRTEEFPEAELRELAGLGLFGIAVPEEHGGAGAGAVAYSLAMQELAAADASVAVAVSVTNMVAELIARVGSDAQRREHLPRLVGGEYLCGAFALSEPHAGSDPAALRTTATRTEGGWRLRGSKQWITGGDRAGLMVVWAVTDPAAGHKGISCFLVPGGAPGLHVSRREDKMGLRGSSTVGLTFEDVEVGDDALLGQLGGGFKLAMAALDGGRIGIASQALGVARMALEAALAYSQERVAFGVPIAQHQAIGNMLADSATWLEAARLMVLRAAWRKDRGLPFSREAAMGKLLATERAGVICDLALQIHGGYGYTRDFPVERACRDVRVTRIYEGTSEIQRIVIARQLIKEASGE
ncbi:MAG TPA: acyl-CoA dehydrogenase family protein [Kofleriaceae bacterium]|nr:acyl-CoA dehydrogenase family protein [Kofleriaceae bacterium]